MEYSIWVVPPEPIYSQIKDIIGRLSKTYGGPLFEPHMTILGGILANDRDIKAKTNLVASRFSNLELILGPVSFSTTYFQSVFVRVNSTAQLLDLNLDLKREFGMENTVFMPHISLMYGDHEMKIREKVALSVDMPKKTFFAEKLVVIPSTSDPLYWTHSLEIPLGLRL